MDLQLPGADLRPGADPASIAGAEQGLGVSLPADYRAFLCQTDGIDTELDGHYLVLWSVDELLAYADAYGLLPSGPRGLLIGSNGGPTAFAVWDGRYISIPFVAAGPLDAEVRVLASDFAGFLAAISTGQGW